MSNFDSKTSPFSCARISCFYQCFNGLILSSIRFMVLKINPLWNTLSYFVSISLVGYLILRVTKTRDPSQNPKSIDVFFTSVSAVTGSSMSTVNMETFSNFQLVIMTILMFVGGEVFVSMFALLARSKFYSKNDLFKNKVNLTLALSSSSSSSLNFADQGEHGIISDITKEEFTDGIENDHIDSSNDDNINYNSIRVLIYVVLGYILVIHVVGSVLVALYISFAPSAHQVLKQKGLKLLTFSVFTTVATFSNCGFVPTNENMVVFKKNALLLSIIAPQSLLGNTLYPSSLRFLIWVLKKTTNRKEIDYILRNSDGIIYRHLLSRGYSLFLAVTVIGFIIIQWVLFCALQWNSEVMSGLNIFEKLVGSLFQVVNSRHTGEFVFDISIISPALLVLFIVMMYLPSYTAFYPRNSEGGSRNFKLEKNKKKSFVQNLILSQLSYLVIFIILVCITEREKMNKDPLNFNVLNITVEVISAYGNVGLTTGYSCKRQLTPDSSCKDEWYGLVGKWSNGGKVILILVMFFGRLKKYNINGGKAWIIS